MSISFTHNLLDDSFIDLMGLLERIVVSQKGVVVPDGRVADCQQLIEKLLLHAGSVHHLKQGTTVPIDGGRTYVDVPSGFVLARAALETYLMFHYVFVDSHFPSDQFEYRYSAWQLESLVLRQGVSVFPIRDNPTIIKLLQELEDFKMLTAKIQQTTEFQGFSKDKQKKILARVEQWKPSWGQIARNAGFHSEYFKRVYGFLSLYAHSGSIAAWHIASASHSNETLNGLFELSVFICELAISRAIQDYLILFPAAQGIADQSPQLMKLAQAIGEAWNNPPRGSLIPK